MLKSFEHIGMQVSDFDASLAFYVDLLGLRCVLRKVTDNGQLAFLDAGGGMLEMSAPAQGGLKRAEDPAQGHAGIKHITFCYDNVDAIFEKLEQAGVEIHGRPRATVHAEILRRTAFVRDPDGIMIEVVERQPDFLR